MENEYNGLEIAIIGMAGRFPGADNINEFWNNIKNGVESIKHFSDDELEEDDLNLIKDPKYVKARGVMNNIDCFDDEFFKYSPSITALMDPQLMVLHECAWEALEDGGYNSLEYKGLIGSYFAATSSLEWIQEVLSRTNQFTNIFELQTFVSSEFFSTRIAYNLNLKGPSFTVQTACSSSLVAVHLACQALLSGECSMALAGGTSVSETKNVGYYYNEGMIHSSDGHCRAFDEKANGTVPGSGAGVVLLKRLEDAIKDNDNIYAVIKGSAINNDGVNKVGYTAPSIEGEARAIKSALYAAEVESETIGYIETHGTGTVLGDPIEVQGLNLAFGLKEKNVCPIGSVKSNIGHLGYAAGVAGLIKATLSIYNKEIPPSLNFEKANPKIDFNNSPFYVNTKLKKWEKHDYPMRAGVSSFGIGGTNAHVILEEAPKNTTLDDNNGRANLLLLSAKSDSAIKKLSNNMYEYLLNNEDVTLNNVEYTLQTGRRHFNHRKAIICLNKEDALSSLRFDNSEKVYNNTTDDEKNIVFMFPGQGAQYVNMGYELYETEPVFHDEMEKCFTIMNKIVQWDIKKVIFSNDNKDKIIYETFATQPIIFIFEYSLAKLLMYWGVNPSAMVGHSIGEYVAACISGVLSLEDALKLVTFRGQLMQEIPHGAMTSIDISVEELKLIINEKISISAINSSSNCVVGGAIEDIESLEEIIKEKGYKFVRLHTSHAFHSSMMNPILDRYRKKVDKVKFSDITIPYLSNFTGQWITNEDVKSSDYWVNHLRNTVKFNSELENLLKDNNCILIEVGPGRTLSNFVKANKNYNEHQQIINIIRHPKEKVSDYYNVLKAIAILWVNGAYINWDKFNKNKSRRKVSLPTYPFERKSFKVNDNSSHKKYINDIERDTKLYERDSLLMDNYIEPRDDIERKLAEVFQNCLGYNKIGINENFFNLGIDSLKAITIVGVLNKDFDINLNQVFEYQTIGELAEHLSYKKDYLKDVIENLRKMDLDKKETQMKSEQYNNELKSELQIYNQSYSGYEHKNLQKRKNYKSILITGATGYLGIYILRDLLYNTDASIYLIIRGKNTEECEKRLNSKIDNYFEENFYDKYSKRITIVNGDITKNNLGIEMPQYKDLCEKVECIIHAAANVSHYGRYSDFFDINVMGTKHMIDMCKEGQKKDFNFISTFAIFENVKQRHDKKIITEKDFEVGQQCDGCYSKSKYEAEELIIQARDEGINCNVFRVGHIMFDSASGKFQENIEQNGVYSMIQAFNKIGVIPEMERESDFSFVDYVSRAIVLLFDRVKLKNENYHVYNPNYVSLSDVLTGNDSRLKVKKVTNKQFVDFLYNNYENDDIYSYLNVLRLHLGYDCGDDASDEYSQFMNVVGDKTNEILNMLSFRWCEVKSTHINKMIEYCLSIGFLH